MVMDGEAHRGGTGTPGHPAFRDGRAVLAYTQAVAQEPLLAQVTPAPGESMVIPASLLQSTEPRRLALVRQPPVRVPVWERFWRWLVGR